MVGSSMFQLLYKTLLISVISGSLSIMNMLAFAQDTASTATTQASATGYTRDSNGVFSKTENHNFQGTKAGEDNALHTITMLAVGFIGTRLLMYKKWTTDMSIAAAGSAAYIAAEIVNVMNLKNQIEDMNVQVTKKSNGQIDQAQIDTLQKLKESYEKVKESLKTRKTLQIAAAVIFTGAAGMAAYARLDEDGQLASCQAGITNATASLSTCAASPTDGPLCSACQASLAHLATSLTTAKANSEIPGPSLAKATGSEPVDKANAAQVATPCAGPTAEAIKDSMVKTSCSTYLVKKQINGAFGKSFVSANEKFVIPGLEKMFMAKISTHIEEKMSVASNYSQRSLLQKMLDTILPRAEAGMLAMLGLGAGAATAFFAVQLKIDQIVDSYMFTPGGRIIAWGIMAGAAFLGAQASQSAIEDVDKHIADIDKILKDLNNLQKGIKSNNVNEQQIKLAALQANQQAALKLNSNAAVKTDCLTSSGSNNCTPLASQMKAMPGFADLPDSFKTVATQAASLGDGLSGTNSLSGSALTAAGALANNKNSIGRLAASVKSKLNDMLAKNGSPKIDYDKEESKLLGQMKIQTAKALSGSGMSAGSFLASTGVSAIDNAKVAIAKIPSGKKSVNLGGDVPKAAEAKKEKDLDFNFKETQAEGAARGEAGAAAAAAKEKDLKYDIGENDINTNSGDSIFQVISNRYIKSGYPRLLEEIPLPVKK